MVFCFAFPFNLIGNVALAGLVFVYKVEIPHIKKVLSTFVVLNQSDKQIKVNNGCKVFERVDPGIWIYVRLHGVPNYGKY